MVPRVQPPSRILVLPPAEVAKLLTRALVRRLEILALLKALRKPELKG